MMLGSSDNSGVEPPPKGGGLLTRMKYRILFVSLYNDEAYGMRILHSIVYNLGYDCRMLFLKLNWKTCTEINRVTENEIGLFKNYIQNFRPDVISFSLVSSNFTLYKKLYMSIRSLGNFKVVVGGWQASLNPEDTLKYADIVCIGEGEDTIVELAERLYRNESVDAIRNLYTKKDGKIIKNKIRPLITNFDYHLPIFDNDISCYIEDNKLVQKDPYKHNNRYGIMIGRGCPYNCTYCSNSYMKKIYAEWSRIRYRSTDHMLSELKKVKKELPNIQRINFYDEVFLFKDNTFFKRYKEEIGLPFYCMFYPGTCNHEFACILKESGLVGVWLGIQSGSEKIRKEIFKRYYTNDTIKQQANIFNDLNISVRYDFILDNPFENVEDIKDTFKLLKELPKPFSVNIFSLKFFPNTEITRMALDRGLITEQQLNDQLKDDHQVYLVNDDKKNMIRKILDDSQITIM